MMLADGLVFSRLLLFASTWDLISNAAWHTIHAVHLRVLRKITGDFRTTERPVTDQHVLQKVGCNSVMGMIKVARMRYIARISREAPVILIALLQNIPNGIEPWLAEVFSDLRDLQRGISPTLDSLPDPGHSLKEWICLWIEHPMAWKSMLKRFKCRMVPGNTGPAGEGHANAFVCLLCEPARAFVSKSALCTHLYRKHNQRKTARLFVKDKHCPCCGKDFLCRARAMHHVQFQSGTCLNWCLTGHVMPIDEEEATTLDRIDATFRLQSRRRGLSYLARSTVDEIQCAV